MEKSETELLGKFMTSVRIENGHWVWSGASADYKSSTGDYITYPKFNVGKGVRVLAHRYSYEQFVGKLSRKELIVNSCGNTLCVRPDHWNIRLNLTKRTHCVNGHALDKETLGYRSGHYICRKCYANARAKFYGRSIPFPVQ